jgi:O-acetylhomoserine/O-acetylserine sulfhydrylase-like pyridoxal-dependent enzyme
MKSENQNNSLFRPLKKASTVALVAFALFASAAHADLGTKITGKQAEAIFTSIPGAPEVRKETKESIELFKENRAAHVTCFQKINLADKQGNVKKTECFQLTEADLAK